MYIRHWIIISIKHILIALHLIHFVQILQGDLLILLCLFIVNHIEYFIYTYITHRLIIESPLIVQMGVGCLVLLNVWFLKWCLNCPVQIWIILVFFGNNILLVLCIEFSKFVQHLIRYVPIIFIVDIMRLLRTLGLSCSSLSNCVVFVSFLIFIASNWLVGGAFLLYFIIISECIQIGICLVIKFTKIFC